MLDWAGYFQDFHGLHITPWSPALALGLVFSLRYGRVTWIPWFVAVLLSEILVRGIPESLFTTILISAGLVLSYIAMVEVLRRQITNPSEVLMDQKALLAWFTVVVVGTFASSFLYIALLLSFNLIPSGEWGVALSRLWIGDCVGILVTMPFFWMLFEDRKRMTRGLWHWETVGYLALAIAMLFIAFRFAEIGNFQYFYLLFPPIVWAAARQGVAGAALAAFVLQAGIILVVRSLDMVPASVFGLQILGAVLGFIGLFIGVVIDERQRVSAELRQTLHLAAAGEMAGALAHELNQPLTALSTYGMACEKMLDQGETGERLREVIGKMVSESFRAAEVVRRLRGFFTSGTTQLESLELEELLQAALIPFSTKSQQQNIELSIASPTRHMILADRIQLEVVFRNLISNAFDAVSEQTSGQRYIRLKVSNELPEQVHVLIEDSGLGISESKLTHMFEPFTSFKASGLGLGLAISRSIVEAHGGTLFAEVADHGILNLILPIESIGRNAT